MERTMTRARAIAKIFFISLNPFQKFMFASEPGNEPWNRAHLAMDPRKWAWNRVAPEPFHLARSHDNTICYGCQQFLLNKCNKYVNTRNIPQFIAHFHPQSTPLKWGLAGFFCKICQKAAGDYYNSVTFVTISPSSPPPKGPLRPMRAIYKRKLPPTKYLEQPCASAFLP